MHLEAGAVEHMDARVAEDPGHLRHLGGLVVVVAEHGDRGNGPGRERPPERLRILGLAGVREIAAEGQDVRLLDHVGKERAEGWPGPGASEVQVGQRRDAYPAWSLGHCPQSRASRRPER
jgi:hypothetical protein